jgi:hypothetical protein
MLTKILVEKPEEKRPGKWRFRGMDRINLAADDWCGGAVNTVMKLPVLKNALNSLTP